VKLWDAYRVPSAANRNLIKKTQDAMKGESAKRRGPSHLKKEQYFKIGDIVRRINTQWAGKSGTIRSNALKQGNRWAPCPRKFPLGKERPRGPTSSGTGGARD
jgi:hypothetical protein